MKQEVLLKDPAGFIGLNSPIKPLCVHMMDETGITWQGKETMDL